MFDINDLYYNGAPSWLVKPEENKKDKNIFGMELECNDTDAWYPFSELVEQNIVIIPYNEDEAWREHVYMSAEEDCTAEFEIVFQAERPRNLLLGLKALNTELNPSTVYNGHGNGFNTDDDTSAHIHLNNIYLRNKGIRPSAIAVITELLGAAIFTMSGRIRHSDSMGWSRSFLDNRGRCDILAHPRKKAEELAKYNPIELTKRTTGNPHGGHSDRYLMVNTPTSHDTTELRIFSNLCSYDYDRIHLFLDTANFLIDVADNYQEIPIKECWMDIADDFKKFMTNNRRRKQEAKKIGLEFFWSDAKAYYNYISQNGYPTDFCSMSTEVDALRVLKTLERDYGVAYNGKINLNNVNISEIEEFVENEIGYYNLLLL